MEYEKENRSKITRKLMDRKLKTRYGIDRSIYNLMLASQNGLCLICNKQHSVEKPLNVDHCHQRGTIRGLLCGLCNRGLGLFNDDMVVLQRAINYLKQNG